MVFGKSEPFYNYQLEDEAKHRENERKQARLRLAERAKDPTDLVHLLDVLGLMD